MGVRSFSDADTVFEIVASGTPPSVDGLTITEPKWLACGCCDARVLIDGADGHHTTIDNLPHDAGCPQRAVTSRYFEEQFLE